VQGPKVTQNTLTVERTVNRELPSIKMIKRSNQFGAKDYKYTMSPQSPQLDSQGSSDTVGSKVITTTTTYTLKNKDGGTGPSYTVTSTEYHNVYNKVWGGSFGSKSIILQQ
jgi:hypothetical protein